MKISAKLKATLTYSKNFKYHTISECGRVADHDNLKEAYAWLKVFGGLLLDNRDNALAFGVDGKVTREGSRKFDAILETLVYVSEEEEAEEVVELTAIEALKQEIALTEIIVSACTGEYANTDSAKDTRAYLRGLKTALALL